MDWELTSLPWLAAPPDNFKQQVQQFADSDQPCGKGLRSLATSRLSIRQTLTLYNNLEKIHEKGNLAPLIPFRLSIVGDGTLDSLVPQLQVAALRYGLFLQIQIAPFDQLVQSAMDRNSVIYQHGPDAILVAMHHRTLASATWRGELHDTKNDIESDIESDIERLELIRTGVRSNSDAPLIWQTIVPPCEQWFGSLDAVLDLEATRVQKINEYLTQSCRETNDCLLDVYSLAQSIGLWKWNDVGQWHWAKLPFAQRCLPIYSDYAARVLGALKGKSKRVLVLDLDNTLWGGIIGDDGLEGIQIGQGSPAGEAFLDIQRMALRLRQRGIILAVCSKNTESIAKQPFQTHPEMVLKESDFAVFQANWNDKASNMAYIADTLSLGIDSLVLLDDNPVERAQVREACPEVGVPELPDDPAQYVRTLLATGYFESVNYTESDKDRAEQYTQNSKRNQLAQTVGDTNKFLVSLDMQAICKPFNQIDRPRIVQLINRSNQFNLTTKRYNDQQVSNFENDTEVYTALFRLSDRFGDNGIISIVIAMFTSSAMEIDTWLMSCRVLGRRFEEFVLNELVKVARLQKKTRLVGVYRPTDRNGIVKDLYSKLGFELLEESKEETRWTLDVDTYSYKDAPIRFEEDPR